MIPISKEFNHNYTTILSEDDMKAAGLHHDEPLLKRHKDKTLLRNNQGQEKQKLNDFEKMFKMKKDSQMDKSKAKQT